MAACRGSACDVMRLNAVRCFLSCELDTVLPWDRILIATEVVGCAGHRITSCGR